METYIVKSGDTLWGISNQFGVSVTELASLNNVIGSNLKVGQVLNIPTKSGENPNNMFMYTVKSGDSLYSIAKKYNTTVQKIIDLNYLKTTNLAIGQVLRIPENFTKDDEMYMPQYKNYIVKKGDTLYSIAINNGVDVDTLKKDNALTSNNLTIGKVLKIRIGEEEGVVLECFGEDYNPTKENQTTTSYIVKKGDSLYSIAKKFNTSVSAIMNLNNLKTTNLSINQKLQIPSSINNSSSTTIYTVKKGDSLYSIAKKFNTTVQEIKNKNNLSSNVLSINQQLKI